MNNPTRVTSHSDVSPSTSITVVVNLTTSPPAIISFCSSYHKRSISLMVGSSVVSDILPVRSFKNETLSSPNSAEVIESANIDEASPAELCKCPNSSTKEPSSFL